jgi:lipid A ethanolaminephosphotransferase
MLGLLQVRTEVYQQSLDMFASCRPWLAAKR